MVDNELYRITGKVYKELAELCDKYGECQINWVSQVGLWNIRKRKLTKSEFINIIDTDFCVRLAAHVSNGWKSPIRPSSGKDTAKTKGVHREVESEGRWRQISGLTNRNHIRL